MFIHSLELNLIRSLGRNRWLRRLLHRQNTGVAVPASRNRQRGQNRLLARKVDKLLPAGLRCARRFESSEQKGCDDDLKDQSANDAA